MTKIAMHKLVLLFATALPLAAQIPIHVYDPNAYLALGAPSAAANCTALISGQGNTTATSGAMTVLPIINQPFAIAAGTVDLVGLPL